MARRCGRRALGTGKGAESVNMGMITVIGRGHSGTRVMSHTLYASGVYMGQMLNPSGDLIPPQDMYAACRVLAQHVRWEGGLTWDWSELLSMEPPPEFVELIHSYLRSVLERTAEHKGWKIPETTLVLPWIVHMFPEVRYIYWIRNPLDCILGRHLTDDLRDFGIQYPPTEDERLRRAISWRYQYELVKATSKPEHWLEVRFEDFVLRQDETLARLEGFLGIQLAKIPVRTEAVGRWKRALGGAGQAPAGDCVVPYDLLAPAMIEYGYEVPLGES